MFGKKKFQKRTIGDMPSYKSYSDALHPARKRSFMKIFLILCCVFLVVFMSKYIVTFAKWAIDQITKGTVSVISNSLGQSMTGDEYGNINVMIVGYGGTGHAGSYLADSIMVASFNPKLDALTMLSIPRDLEVYDTGRWIRGRVNEVFSVWVGRNREFATGAALLSSMLENIMWIKINYYALVDFWGFKWLIDTLGGITIDVPESFVDTTYPTLDNGYMTVSFTSWVNQFDGEKALEYARSRHSTSDFARSLRQQLIIKAVMDKLIDKGVTNITKVKKLYADYTTMVQTNISLKEIMGMVKYMYNLNNIFSYGYTTECSELNYKYSTPACFLYTPDRSLFGGASVMIPDGSTPANVWFYDYTQKFASYVIHHQGYLIEHPKIAILNGIDKKFAKQTLRISDGFANQLAVKLKKYAFDISNVQNFTQPISWTTLYVVSTWKVDQTIKMLQTFVPIFHVEKDTSMVDPALLSWYDLVLVLGNDYIPYLTTNPFSYYK